MEILQGTPQFCEAMYGHYADILTRPDLAADAKAYATEAQLYYIYMHELLVDFHIYAEQLGFSKKNQN